MTSASSNYGVETCAIRSNYSIRMYRVTQTTRRLGYPRGTRLEELNVGEPGY